MFNWLYTKPDIIAELIPCVYQPSTQVLIGVIVQVTKESVEGDLSGVTNSSKSWCLFSHAPIHWRVSDAPDPLPHFLL